MVLRDDLSALGLPDGVEVVQLTHGDLPSTHVYMEAQIFGPDSQRFVLHESATPHGSDKADPNHRYLVCDLASDCELHPLTDEVGVTAPSVTSDGEFLYYLVDETGIGGGKLTLKRVGLDGSGRETIFILDVPLTISGCFASQIYSLSTIRSDNRKMATSCFLGDGKGEVNWGLLIFDLTEPSVDLVLEGPSWCNMHPQYCRSGEPDHLQDLLVQENHGCTANDAGDIEKLVGGAGADIHVIRDNGSNLRDLPWGRDGNEFCQGHQCWRGTSDWTITSTHTMSPEEEQLIESRTLDHVGHLGVDAKGGIRNDLSRDFPEPHFYHFATDHSGSVFVTDSSRKDQGGRIYLARLNKPGEQALSGWTCLAHPDSSWAKEAHIHPFLSPDGSKAFFNSDESGLLQAYMIRGLENVQLS